MCLDEQIIENVTIELSLTNISEAKRYSLKKQLALAKSRKLKDERWA